MQRVLCRYTYVISHCLWLKSIVHFAQALTRIRNVTQLQMYLQNEHVSVVTVKECHRVSGFMFAFDLIVYFIVCA